jgi:hypothetical protein
LIVPAIYEAKSTCRTRIVKFRKQLLRKQKEFLQYTTAQKLAVIKTAERVGKKEAARKHNVDRRCVQRWCGVKAQLKALSMKKKGMTRKRLAGGGRSRKNFI